MTALLITIAAVATAVILLYNRLVRDRNRVDGAWGDIDVQLQRRHDLVPRLVRAVDQYSTYERATIEAVTALRAEAVNTRSVERLGQTEEELSAGVMRLIALAEQYPDLKANENFLELQRDLVETENYLQFARRYYNGAVRELNTRVESFPSNAVASIFSFEPREYFQKGSDDAAAVPLVEFGKLEE